MTDRTRRNQLEWNARFGVLSDQQVAQALRDAGVTQVDLDILEECERDALYHTYESWRDHMVLVREYVADLADCFGVPFADYSAYRKLLRVHHDRLDAVEDELEAGKKASCWLWWVLPTGRKLLMRFSDDLKKPHPLSPSWRRVLELLNDLRTRRQSDLRTSRATSGLGPGRSGACV